ncbi:MAG: S41 family peptidase [Bryobacteraceae bacterium]|jgi:carboxyl-terminal processing protease
MGRQVRPFVLSAVFIAICALLSGSLGPGSSAHASSTVLTGGVSGESELDSGLKLLTSIYRLAEENAAEKVSPDKSIYDGAIPGMLRTLDPHSNFFDPKEFNKLREDQRGRYYGVGMTIQPRGGHTVVVYPFPGSPAFKAGLRPGDLILEINDKSALGLNSSEVADLLKGPRGTAVQVKISREGKPEPLVFNLIRDAINRPSVPTKFFIRPGIAYIHIEQFNETTSRELDEALSAMNESSLKGLVLDLRDNPGGLLNEGVAVAGRFLKRGQTVVSHRGRTSPEKPYVATNGSSGREYPIVVLVSRLSASAAEIVAGALQDHDRGWVFGDNTFGKGLVQTVFPLMENTGLALTTAKYYTPSGRLIQRDYSSGSFYDYYFHRDSEKKSTQDVKMTDSGRTVYGGSGITPDEKFTIEYKPFQIDLLRRAAFRDFLPKYFGNHDAKLPKDWSPDEAMMADFHAYLLKNNFQFSEADWGQWQDWIRVQLKREALLSAVGLDESNRYATETDPIVLKALESMPKAKALLDNARKQMVQLDQRSLRH